MIRPLLLAALMITLAGCAAQIEEEVVIVEPVVAEPVADPSAKGPDNCEAIGDDGIGGTGCPQEP